MNLQQQFFEQLKNKIPSHLSLVDEVANLLNVSDDSVYRRMRGSKELSFSELQLLAAHFQISVDALLSAQNEQMVLFADQRIDQHNFTFEKYLQSLIGHLGNAKNAEKLELIYSAKDFPLFHYFQFPKLAAFKLFFWQKSVLDFDQHKNTKFSKEIELPELKLGKQALQHYYQLPSTEIWSEEIIHSTLRQIEFYHESGFFDCPETIEGIIGEMEQMLNHLHNMASDGCKYLCQQKPGDGARLRLYFNEMILANNSLLVKSNTQRMVFLTYNQLNYLTTTNEGFCSNFHDSLDTLISKSTLISKASEKIRNMFFNRLSKKVEETKKKVVGN